MANKRKKFLSVSEDLADIKNLLVSLKPLFSQTLLPSGPSEFLDTLTAISHRAGELAAHWAAGKMGKLTLDEQDLLDAEGVAIWNRSGEFRAERDSGKEIFGAMRLAAYRLIVAGNGQDSGVKDLIRLLTLGGKAASAATISVEHKEVEAILTQCAMYEQRLAAIPASPAEDEAKDRARSVCGYFVARTEFHFRQKDLDPASFHFKKACDEHRLALLAPKDIYYLVLLAQEIGSSLIQSPKDTPEIDMASRGLQAVDWLTAALRLGEQALRSGTLSANDNAVRRETLKLLALAFMQSSPLKPEYLERAEATLDELLVDPELTNNKAEAERVRWLRLDCLQRRNASDAQIIAAFRDIIDNSALEAPHVDNLLRDAMHKPTFRKPVAIAVLHALLAALTRGEDRQDTIQKVILSILVYAKGEENVDKACREVKSAFDAVENSALHSIGAVAACAFQNVLWQMGDRAYSAVPGRYAEAVKCYDLGTHSCLRSMESDFPKIHRKVALCYLKLQELERATDRVRLCPPEEAATFYLRFLIAVQGGLEDEAVSAIKNMAKRDDSDGKMLILATSLANEAGLRSVIMTTLSLTLEGIQAGTIATSDVAVLVLVRCLVRLTMKRIEDPTILDAERTRLIAALIFQFESALQSVESKSSLTVIVDEKELAWLYKTAFNAGVIAAQQGWPESAVYKLFEVATALMRVYGEIAVNIDPDLAYQRALGSYAATAGRSLEAKTLSGETRTAAFRSIVETSAPSSFDVIIPLLDSTMAGIGIEWRDRLVKMSQVVRIFQVEAFCELKDWPRAQKAIEESSSREIEASTELYEALCNLVWTSRDCPPDTVFEILERLLRSGLAFDKIRDLSKFSRWLRTVLSICFARERPEDLDRALGYIGQATELLKVHAGDADMSYPTEEIDWLLSMSWNKGNDEASTSSYERARAFYEAALGLVAFVPPSGDRVQKMQRRYGEVLAQLES